ncbi:hypothetical protein LDENG_00244420 [Lucifuga dentata]|nr:hypothetical protein LDENG_00244420 [Lucifuga dentata]
MKLQMLLPLCIKFIKVYEYEYIYRYIYIYISIYIDVCSIFTTVAGMVAAINKYCTEL